MITEDAEVEILKLCGEGLSIVEIAARAGVSRTTVRAVVAHGGVRSHLHAEPSYLPTQAEIAAECAKIQAGWSEATRNLRCQYRAEPWTLPEVDCHSVGLSFSLTDNFLDEIMEDMEP